MMFTVLTRGSGSGGTHVYNEAVRGYALYMDGFGRISKYYTNKRAPIKIEVETIGLLYGHRMPRLGQFITEYYQSIEEYRHYAFERSYE